MCVYVCALQSLTERGGETKSVRRRKGAFPPSHFVPVCFVVVFLDKAILCCRPRLNRFVHMEMTLPPSSAWANQTGFSPFFSFVSGGRWPTVLYRQVSVGWNHVFPFSFTCLLSFSAPDMLLLLLL